MTVCVEIMQADVGEAATILAGVVTTPAAAAVEEASMMELDKMEPVTFTETGTLY